MELEIKMDMSQDVVVSVMMIAYNVGKYIDYAIAGVMGQNTDFSMELVIGEDQSTDDTYAKCCAWKERFPGRIRLVRNERNLGLSRNYQSTWHHCKGKYVAVCDGDERDQHLRRGGVDVAYLDEEFQPDIVQYNRPGDTEQVTEQLCPAPQRRVAEGDVFLQPEPRKERDRETDQKGCDVGRNDHDSQIDEPLVDNDVVQQCVEHPVQDQIPPSANRIAERLPRDEPSQRR